MELYDHQKHVARALRAGENVILQAPTGAGKTLAALWPFLEAWDRNTPGAFPRKCIYSVPMRVLANQFEREASRLVKEEMLLAEHPGIAVQTGDRPEDRHFEKDLIFATIDQTLSSFVHMPYSLPRKLANLNAGAIAAAYLVFDEFHLFEPDSTLPTTLEMLRILNGVAPFVLMTATFSSRMLGKLGEFLNARVIPDPHHDRERRQMLELPVEKSKSRFYHWSDEPLTAGTVLKRHHGHTRSLVVCNVVDRAQQVYRDLRDHPGRGDTEVILLHSRYLPDDRKEKEERLLSYFGKQADRKAGSIIAVATQVVEVGLDISADVLHSELAPANAILQRAGRCARYMDETGHVYVYGVPDYLPYASEKAGDEPARRVIEQTRAWLASHDESQRVGFLEEQEWIDSAHTERDEALLLDLAAGRWQYRRRLEAALAGDRQEAGEIIRRIVSQPLTISARPDDWLARPFDAPLFSLHPGTLKKAAKRWLETDLAGVPRDARIKKLVEAAEDEQSETVRYHWQPIEKPQDMTGAPLIVVHPDLASYDPDVGLILDRGGGFWDEPGLLGLKQSANRSAWFAAYKAESYRRHVELVYRQFQHRVWPELKWAAARLEGRAGWPAGSVERAAALAVLFHDLGKLTATCNDRQGWQAWAGAWQKKVGGPTLDMYAHTDYDGSEAHQRLGREMGARPPHAVEGAVAAAPLLAQSLREQPALLKAAFSAIARHHGAFSSSFSRYRLVNGAAHAVQEILPLAGPYAAGIDPHLLRLSDDPHRTKIGSFLVNAQADHELVAYMLLARALRLADQWGTAVGAKE